MIDVIVKVLESPSFPQVARLVRVAMSRFADLTASCYATEFVMKSQTMNYVIGMEVIAAKTSLRWTIPFVGYKFNLRYIHIYGSLLLGRNANVNGQLTKRN